jgi:hypothetical protein
MPATVEEKLKLSKRLKRPADEYVAAATAGRFAGEPGNYAPPSVEPPSPSQAPPAEDLLWGAAAIAEFLGVSVNTIYYYIREKKLPISKLGKKTVLASKKKLLRALNDTLTP